MSLNLTEDQIAYLQSTLRETRTLLDNVHCYDTEEFQQLGVALHILDGHSVEVSESLNQD